jgi:hypothetical protein
MGVLLLGYRKLLLLNRREDIQYKMMRLNQQLIDAQDYAASLSDGKITFDEMINAPVSFFGRMNAYAINSHQQGMAHSDMMLGKYYQAGMFSQENMKAMGMQNDQQAAAYVDLVKYQMYNQAKEAAAKQEEAQMAALDKKIQMELEKVKNQLTMVEKELERLDGAFDKAAETSAPKYVTGGR